MNTINNQALPITVALSATVGVDLIKPILNKPSNKDGHSIAHGLGKLEDSYNRNLISAEQLPTGNVLLSTTSGNYDIPVSSLIVRAIVEILGNGKNLDTESLWLQSGCVTSNQFKLLNSGGVSLAKQEKGVSYTPANTVDASIWLDNALVLNFNENLESVLAAIPAPVQTAAAFNNFDAIKDKEAKTILQNLLAVLLPASILASAKEIQARQAKELTRFNFVTVNPLTGFQAISLDGVEQKEQFFVEVAAIDAKQFVADCKTVTGLDCTHKGVKHSAADADTGISEVVSVSFWLNFSKVITVETSEA